MKKILFIIVGFALGVLNLDARQRGMAKVIMNNGVEYDNVELVLPRGWDDELKMKTVNGKQIKVKSDSVNHLMIWHRDFPERKGLLMYKTYTKFNDKTGEIKPEKFKIWLALESAGKHLSYWIRFNEVKTNKKNITYSLVTSSSPYFFVKSENPAFAVEIPINVYRIGKTQQWLCSFLASDPDLTRRISENGYYSKKDGFRHEGNDYNPFFFEEIAVDYNPK